MSGRRVLICAPRMPEYDREGGSRRVFHLIELLREAGWSVTFVARYATDGERYARLLRQMGVITYAGEESAWIGDAYLDDFSALVHHGQFDLAILAFWDIAERYEPIIRSMSPTTRIVVDSIDVHFLRHSRRLLRKTDGAPGGMLDAGYADEMTRELNVYARADAVFAVSQKETDLIGDFLDAQMKTYMVPLLEDMAPGPSAPAQRAGLIFVANFRHPPNIEGLEYLCRNIVPHLPATLLTRHPLMVVGNALEMATEKVGDAVRYAQMIGWVPSVEPYLQRARVSVVPLLHGAGTKTKLIQALTVGTPSVSTRIGVEGLDLVSGEDVIVADDPERFADGIVHLAEDDTLWQKMRLNGQTKVASMHSRKNVRTRLLQAIEQVLAGPRR